MRNGAGRKRFIIGDYSFCAYMNWAGPNFLPLAVYDKINGCLKWDVILEFKGNGRDKWIYIDKIKKLVIIDIYHFSYRGWK